MVMIDNNDQCPSFAIKELKEIPCGMLSSPQIATYFRHNFLIKNPSINLLKGATYDMRLGGPAYRFTNGEKNVINLSEEEDTVKNTKKRLILPPNSLTFVTTQEEFRLTRDVIARFNLKSKWVHKGLLLGTGPIIDPEFDGFLYIPIHNFSSKSVDIEFGNPLIVIEFTKTLDVTSGYIKNPSKQGKIANYLNSAGDIESSVSSALFAHTATLEEAKKSVIKAETTINTIRRYGTIASLATLGAIMISLHSLYNGVNSRLDSIMSSSSKQANVSKENAIELEKKLYSLSEELAKIRKELDENRKKESITRQTAPFVQMGNILPLK